MAEIIQTIKTIITRFDPISQLSTIPHARQHTGPLCNCEHTHIYEGVLYDNCPYCECSVHSLGDVLSWQTWNVDSPYRKVIRRRPIDAFDALLGLE